MNRRERSSLEFAHKPARTHYVENAATILLDGINFLVFQAIAAIIGHKPVE